jgi:magnesium-transporting ATPase (P-type)
MDTLRGDHTEEAVRERIAGRRIVSSGGKESTAMDSTRRPGLLIDIQSKIQQGKGEGYVRWAKTFNLKQAAQTLIYLQEHGLDDYNALKEKSEAVAARFNSLSDSIRQLESGLKSNAELQKHIVNYSKTRQTYTDYRKAGFFKAFRAEHEADIILHQAAKAAFNELGYGPDKKLPTVKTLRTEYAAALEEKRKAYAEYKTAKAEMRELLTAKENADRLLILADTIKKDAKAAVKRPQKSGTPVYMLTGDNAKLH